MASMALMLLEQDSDRRNCPKSSSDMILSRKRGMRDHVNFPLTESHLQLVDGVYIDDHHLRLIALRCRLIVKSRANA